MAKMIERLLLDTALSLYGRSNQRSLLPMIVFFVVIASACLVWSPGAEGQSPTIDYGIRMERSEIWIDPRPGYDNTASNILIIKNDSIHSLSFVVQASCHSELIITPIDLDVEVTSQKHEDAENNYYIDYTISTTPDTDINKSIACSISPQVHHVDGISSPDASFRSTGFTVHFLPDPSVGILVPDEYRYNKISPGDEFTLPVKVYNFGILPDDIQIEIINAKELEAEGWSINYITPIIWNIAGRQPYIREDRNVPYTMIHIIFQAPGDQWFDWKDESISVELMATSIGWGSNNITSSDSATIWVKGLSHSNWSVAMVLESVILLGVIVPYLRLRRRSDDWLSPDCVR